MIQLTSKARRVCGTLISGKYFRSLQEIGLLTFPCKKNRWRYEDHRLDILAGSHDLNQLLAQTLALLYASILQNPGIVVWLPSLVYT